jgi:hypothetical protein
MKIVTSFSPHRIARQQDCLASWRSIGLEVIGVQTEGEVASLYEHFRDVSFVEVPRFAGLCPWSKPYLPRLSEIMKQADDDAILILNSDIMIAGSPELILQEWSEEDPDVLVVGIRRDHRRGRTQAILNPYGIDAFRLTADLVADLETDLEFAIGVPGWDYWIPWKLWQEGKNIRVANCHLMHEMHDLGYPREAIRTAYELLEREYRMPHTVFTYFIQWATNRTGMKRRPGIL